MVWRARQFVRAISARPDPNVDVELRRLLPDKRQWSLLERLAPFDRAHSLKVHTILLETVHDNSDLLLAALLHDVGKADEQARANAGHRCVNVLLARVAPRALDRLTAAPRRGPTRGLWLARHHAALGAALALAAGASERCADLIARHEDRDLSDDPAIAALARADDAAIQ